MVFKIRIHRLLVTLQLNFIEKKRIMLQKYILAFFPYNLRNSNFATMIRQS